MTLDHRFATEVDLDLLAEWNLRLIRDSGHRNPMTVPELRERMRGWLASGEYRAVVFSSESHPVAYALYREGADEVFLRQLFVRRDRRRRGMGRSAMNILFDDIWPKNKRLTVDVLSANDRAVTFWRALGYRDYSMMLERMP